MLDYGFVCTTSTRTYGTVVGAAFGNPYSFASIDGVPYIYSSLLDASAVDLFTGNGSVSANQRGSLSLSEASYPGKTPVACRIGGSRLGDPENPLCARLVLSGKFEIVARNSTEAGQAKVALFARHPAFENYPASHDFFVGKLNIDGIWLLDRFGGASIVSPAEYFDAY